MIAGPIEATAISNVLMQAIALGHLTSLDEARAVVRHSFKPETYEPQTSSAVGCGAYRATLNQNVTRNINGACVKRIDRCTAHLERISC